MENHDGLMLTCLTVTGWWQWQEEPAINQSWLGGNFDVWVENKHDVALRARPMKSPQIAMANQPQMQDYLQMSRLLASMVGQWMMQFSQAVAMQANRRNSNTRASYPIQVKEQGPWSRSDCKTEKCGWRDVGKGHSKHMVCNPD
jgi:hypothetical protein